MKLSERRAFVIAVLNIRQS